MERRKEQGLNRQQSPASLYVKTTAPVSSRQAFRARFATRQAVAVARSCTSFANRFAKPQCFFLAGVDERVELLDSAVACKELRLSIAEGNLRLLVGLAVCLRHDLFQMKGSRYCGNKKGQAICLISVGIMLSTVPVHPLSTGSRECWLRACPRIELSDRVDDDSKTVFKARMEALCGTRPPGGSIVATNPDMKPI